MKRIFLNKLFLVFSSALLFIYGVIYACGGGYDYDFIGYNSNFTPETFTEESYTPLFLSGDVFYEIGFVSNYNSRFNDNIAKDWKEYLKQKADTATINFFLLDKSKKEIVQDESFVSKSEFDLDQLHLFYTSKKKNETSEKWSKKINLKDKEIKNFLEFMYLAKRIESSSVGNYEYWSYEPAEANLFSDWKWIGEIEKNYTDTKDSFLKNRYWFQTMKAYFYSDNNKKAIDFFNKTEASVPKNTLYYRALAYVAGVQYKVKNYAQSNYLYAQVFDKCPQMRVVAAYNFHPQEEKDWNESLQLAKNNQEKAALWAVQGYYKNETEAIEKIFGLDPKSEHLNYLLTRLVNKQEDKINNSFQKDTEPDAKAKSQTVAENKAYNKSKVDKIAFDLVTKITASGNTNKPYLWDTALGYLQTLNGDFSKAENSFEKAEKSMPKTELANNQLRLLRFVNNMSKITKLTDKNVNSILKDLNWLYQELPKEYRGTEFRYQNASQWSKTYLSRLYKEQSNPVMAELFGETNSYYWGNGNSFYDNEKNLLAMKTFLAKPNKTEIEQTGFGIYGLKLKDINNFQAVKATYQNKISDAITFIKEADSVQYMNFLGNPFNGNIKDCHDCDHTAYQKKKYSQLDFLQTIQLMQDKIAKNEDTYTNSLLLGNAFYNITHFGNGRTFYEINIVGYGSSPYSFRDSMKKMITNCSLPKMYYQKALEAATTKEQKAKCIYLLAKCERNEYYNKKYNSLNNWWEVEDNKINFLAWSGFKTLKNEYSDTKYYKEVLAECGYFNTYVNK
ncbi:hypothetical protein GON26_03910 [Flavobacterium sp. GA093]|uniref:Tetratricopeptide repeat-containing protein n=1 Tax=Flavobacterium hydrocarbonoxydans TaxID=2683249 RepID=A0A6I4NKX0_9FLAO|nr:hypothetical protein [Flavobacterium hydrocarbonoxydans]MWB93492.1 hypothetical protein [Flavobacterium hydrocarbonoxydans]